MWAILLLACLASPAPAAAAAPLEIGLQCADVVCAGNATCIIKVSNGEPVCLGRTKKGTCPFTQLASCNEIQMMCMEDDDCPGRKICCQSDCDRVCMEPGEDLPKPGHCPSRFAFGPCVHECSEDGECPGSTKCCSTGCGRICSSPYLAKAGSCSVPSGGGGSCAIECSIDDECSGDLKCCSSGCGRSCQPPAGNHICPSGTSFFNKCNLCTCGSPREPVDCEKKACAREKPGYCPALYLHAAIKSEGCGTRCYDDEECSGESKCCDIAGCWPDLHAHSEREAGNLPGGGGQRPVRRVVRAGRRLPRLRQVLPHRLRQDLQAS
ncbi:WAP four-disulfide core domain protein 3-like [Pollicipes pollicipes]|uniref:WAP four-disulfide core domain protein 3-like n=1 Tax=Pollicipes pollicipes TaxID=41117 RepID=UPI00188570A4|nr:WAP four-disulfide core domain protein 3-like [Pollicipes pollicipes]